MNRRKEEYLKENEGKTKLRRRKENDVEVLYGRRMEKDKEGWRRKDV